MYRPTFAFGAFSGPEDDLLSDAIMRECLECLTRADCHILRYYPHIPLLHKSGVVYHHDGGNEDDDWQDVLVTLEHGFGDCEDLACWRASELIVRFGIPAFADFSYRWTWKDGRRVKDVHIFTRVPPCPQFPEGRVEDPSVMRGMKVR